MVATTPRRRTQKWTFFVSIAFRQYKTSLTEKATYNISRLVPLALEDLAQVDSMGEGRARLCGEEILATTYAFLQHHHLLHLFLQARAPALAECPLWRAPHSAEAVRARLAQRQL